MKFSYFFCFKKRDKEKEEKERKDIIRAIRVARIKYSKIVPLNIKKPQTISPK